MSDRFRHIVEEKFDIDLSNNPPVIVMMGQTSGAYNEGYAHPDSKHKIITVLLGFSREWPYERGKLRILNGPDREDFTFEYAPEFGKMLMFRVSDKSWHGFTAAKGRAHEPAALLLRFGKLCAERVSAAQAQRLCEVDPGSAQDHWPRATRQSGGGLRGQEAGVSGGNDEWASRPSPSPLPMGEGVRRSVASVPSPMGSP